MKRIKLLVASLLVATASVNAQTQLSETFNYQAVARNISGLTMNNQDISIQISVLNSGIAVYTETHTVTTSKFGMFTLSIGSGIPSLGDFSTIDWSTGNYNVEVAMDEKGGSDYTIMGESALKAVPYAMHSKTAANVFSGDYNDLINIPNGGDKAAGDPWLWGGNAGTTNGIDFIGTTDAQDLDIRTNNVKRLRITQKGQIEVLNTGRSVFIGEEAGKNDNASNNYCVFIGYETGKENMNGQLNTAIGSRALKLNKGGDQNSAVGYASLFSNTLGSYNSAVGYKSLFSNTSGSHNSANGNYALFSNTSGSRNSAIGSYTLYYNKVGSFNSGVGHKALYYNESGSSNNAIGREALYYNKSGSYNNGIGYQALYYNKSSYNNAIGYQALYSNDSGSNNNAIGYVALYSNNSGILNSAIGNYSLNKNTEGSYNTAQGALALLNNSIGDFNSAFGYSAFRNGYNYSNSTALGYNSTITASNQVRIGNNVVTSIGGFTNWSNVSDARFKTDVKENVAGLNFIMSLRPVTYHLDLDKIDKFLGVPDSISKANESMIKARQEKESMLQTGFIAQEVEAAAKKVGYNFSGVDVPKNDNDHYGIRYAEFVVPLVKAVQEQQQTINSQKELIKELVERLDKVEKQIK